MPDPHRLDRNMRPPDVSYCSVHLLLRISREPVLRKAGSIGWQTVPEDTMKTKDGSRARAPNNLRRCHRQPKPLAEKVCRTSIQEAESSDKGALSPSKTIQGPLRTQGTPKSATKSQRNFCHLSEGAAAMHLSKKE